MKQKLREIVGEDKVDPIETVIAELRAYHTPTAIPPCHLCGAKLTLQAMGGGEPTRWACSDYNEDGTSKEGRRPADDHYRESLFIDRRHDDPRVLRLITECESLAKQVHEIAKSILDNTKVDGLSHSPVAYEQMKFMIEVIRSFMEELVEKTEWVKRQPDGSATAANS